MKSKTPFNKYFGDAPNDLLYPDFYIVMRYETIPFQEGENIQQNIFIGVATRNNMEEFSGIAEVPPHMNVDEWDVVNQMKEEINNKLKSLQQENQTED